MGRSEKTTHYQRVAILDWLEAAGGENFRLITGSATKTMKGVVAGAKVTKEAGYSALADYVNQKCATSWTMKMAEARYKAYLKLFKETKRNFLNPCGEKYCLSDWDITKGLTTIELKLEYECPLFSRLDRLFGERQNVIPLIICEPGQTIKSFNTSKNSPSAAVSPLLTTNITTATVNSSSDGDDEADVESSGESSDEDEGQEALAIAATLFEMHRPSPAPMTASQNQSAVAASILATPTTASVSLQQIV